MLLFITVPLRQRTRSCNFKTSHVIVYLFRSARSAFMSYFKTSHVIVYQRLWITACKWIFYFKTSHVIVYPETGANVFNIHIFQNISCYCLSRIGANAVANAFISKHLMLLFIHTFCKNKQCNISISKHLMLLFILIHDVMVLGSIYFKTSHVIVYPSSGS